MIVQRVHPPLLETPFDVFDTGVITPNDRFFVRWAGGVMPTSIAAKAHRLTLRGAVKQPVALTLDEVAHGERPEEEVAQNIYDLLHLGFPRATLKRLLFLSQGFARRVQAGPERPGG